MGDHLRRHGWSGRGPSMAAILGPGGPSTATYFAADGPGDLFWGDHLWHDRSSARGVASMAPRTTVASRKSPFPWEQNNRRLLEKFITLERKGIFTITMFC